METRRYQDMKKADLIRRIRELETECLGEREILGVVERLKAHHDQSEAASQQLVEMQSQLERALIRYSDLYDFAPIGYATLDRYGALEEINLTAAQLIGRERTELLGQFLVRYVEPSDRSKLLKHLNRCRRETTPVSTELALAVGSRSIPVQLYSRRSTLPNEHGSISFRTAFIELTERLRVEEALRRMNEELEARVLQRTLALERANRDLEAEVEERRGLEAKLREQAEALAEADRRKDEFLAMLGHELRNPLAPIVSALALLRSSGGERALTERALGVMDRQVNHMVQLIDDLLDVARISRGKIRVRKQLVQIADVVARALETARPAIENGHHELDVTTPDTPIWTFADPVRLTQVIANLLNNAAKYTPPHGRITLDVEREDATVVIRVRDTGMGIDAKLLPHVFELFFQANQALDRAKGGLGLGLSLARILVEMHGGSIVAASDGPGRGSEFCVRLPVVPELPADDAEASAPPAALASGGHHLRILVVDDNIDAADNLAELLESKGHEVRAVYDGPAALAMADAFKPELILLDIGLPQMDGYEVATRLRAAHTDGSMSIIAVTGYGEADARRRSKEAGFDGHLLKPLGLEQIEGLLASRLLN